MPLFTLIVIIFQSLIFLGHWFLYKTAIRFLGLRNALALKMIFFVLSVSFFSASMLVFRYNKPIASLIYTLSAAWLGVFHYLLWCSFLCWIALWAHSLWGLRFRPDVWAAGLFSLGLFVSFFAILNAGTIRTRKIDITLPGLPANWKGKTAVWASDLHLGPVRGLAFSREIAQKINLLSPDILFLGGDLYDGTAGDAALLASPFSGIKPPLGIWFIAGNHEEFSARSKQKYIRAIKAAGINVLDNEIKTIEGLQIAGVDYMDTFTAAKYRAVLKKMPFRRDGPVVLLKHSPMYPEIAKEEGVAFQISGHTHGGQVFPASLITRWVYKGFDNGLKTLGPLVVYTSPGAGTWGPPMRMGTTPEIVLIRFQ